jgi:hypothetical protein
MDSAAYDPRIATAIIDWNRAGHGAKRAIVERLAGELGVSIQTAYRRLDAIAFKGPRKRRNDAGDCALTHAEAELIWALVRETTRLTGTGALPIMDAVEILRANGWIQAARVDETTGEFLPLSESSIRRCMRAMGYSVDQMMVDSPAIQLSSPHPNWCWQIDASISRQLYLADDGSRLMDRMRFYRGKPKNFEAIADRRIWRYAVTDHASGAFEVLYVQGAESAANAVAALIHAMTQRPDGTMHGAPAIVMSDPGSGHKNGPMANMLRTLGVRHIPHAAGSARVTGQVENAHSLIEEHFEACLKLEAPVTTIAEINAKAQRWNQHYQATKRHGRTRMTRRDGWLRIRPEQLVLAPPVEVLLQLPNSVPKECNVRDGLIRFGGHVFDVRGMPNGWPRKVYVVRNALQPEFARVVTTTDEGGEAHYLAPRLGRDEFGFLEGAAQIGTEFKGLPETPAEARNKGIEKLAMDAQTLAEAVLARKAKRLPFGGRLDPLKHVSGAIPPAVPRAGTPSQVVAPSIVAGRIEPAPIRAEIPLFNHFEAVSAVKRLVERQGGHLPADAYQKTVDRWPDGMPHDAVESWAAELIAPMRGLRLVDGGAA